MQHVNVVNEFGGVTGTQVDVFNCAFDVRPRLHYNCHLVRREGNRSGNLKS